jgi:hypothetical protein
MGLFYFSKGGKDLLQVLQFNLFWRLIRALLSIPSASGVIPAQAGIQY